MNNETLRKITKHLALAAARLDSVNPKVYTTKSSFPVNSVETNFSPRVAQTQISTADQNINFGKIDEFVSDPLVSLIECGGPDKKIKIKKESGAIIQTNETLALPEIMSIVNQFSRQAKVPVTQMFKAKVKDLSINAFISPVTGARFMILKD